MWLRLQLTAQHWLSTCAVTLASHAVRRVADPNRARVLFALDMVEELCVGAWALALEANEDAVGYALRLLRTAGLVANRKQGRVVYYRLAEGLSEPLREHCLRQLVVLAEAAPDDDWR